MPILNEVYISLLNQVSSKEKELGQSRKSRVVSIFSNINREMITALSAWIKTAQTESLDNTDVILHSSGGDADAAYHLGIMLSDLTKNKLTFIVPRFAKSAAT